MKRECEDPGLVGLMKKKTCVASKEYIPVGDLVEERLGMAVLPKSDALLHHPGTALRNSDFLTEVQRCYAKRHKWIREMG